MARATTLTTRPTTSQPSQAAGADAASEHLDRYGLRVVSESPVIDCDAAEQAIYELLVALGRDPRSEHLAETPRRVVEAYAELLSPEPFDLTTFPNPSITTTWSWFATFHSPPYANTISSPSTGWRTSGTCPPGASSAYPNWPESWLALLVTSRPKNASRCRSPIGSTSTFVPRVWVWSSKPITRACRCGGCVPVGSGLSPRPYTACFEMMCAPARSSLPSPVTVVSAMTRLQQSAYGKCLGRPQDEYQNETPEKEN